MRKTAVYKVIIQLFKHFKTENNFYNYAIIQDIYTCLTQWQSRSSQQHIVYKDRSLRIITTYNLKTKLCISLYTVHFFCATSHLTFYIVQQKLKNFSPLPLLSPNFNRASYTLLLVIKRSGYLLGNGRRQGRLGVAKDTYLTKPADAQRIITSAVPINRSIHTLRLYYILYTMATNQERPLVATNFVAHALTINQYFL